MTKQYGTNDVNLSNFFNWSSYHGKNAKFINVVLVGFSVLILTSLITLDALAWGDNGGGRESYTEAQINSGVLGGTIVFNSISDGVIGNEKNFVGARLNTGINAGADNVWEGNNITIEDGKEYIIRLYVHNNNPNGLDAVAEDVRVAFDIPEHSAKQIQVNGFITSSNATPSKYWDYVNFNSDKAFHLEYVYGSATFENNGIGQNGGVPLGDEIVTKAASENGVLIGYNSLDGKIPGCYTYAAYVGIRVKAVVDYEFTTETKVRLLGESGWQDSITVSMGDQVEFLIRYENTGNITQENVEIRNTLPENLSYTKGSLTLRNTESSGIDEDAFLAGNVNIGSYAAGANADVTFSAEVVGTGLSSESHTLINWVQVSVGSTSQQSCMAVQIQSVNLSRIIKVLFGVLAVLVLIILVKSTFDFLKQKRF